MILFHPMHNNKQIRSFLLIMLSGLFLFSAACAPILSPGEPPTYIQFMPKFQGMKSGNEKTRKLQLSVTLPTAPSELNGDSIILLLKGREFRRFAGHRWVGAVPDLLQRSIINGLESSRAFASVAAAGAGIRPQARIVCDVNNFSFHYPEEKALPTVMVGLTFRVIEASSGTVLGTLPIERTASVPSNDVDQMAAAAEKVTAEIIGELNDWIISLY